MDEPKKPVLGPESVQRDVLATKDADWKSLPRLVASGACMGTADLVPGVSGGTMAVALGIYRELLAAITSVNLEALRALLRGDLRGVMAVVHWRFIVQLGAGLVLALVVMGKLLKLPELVESEPKLVYAVFFGLVVASSALLVRRISTWLPITALLLPVGTVIGFAVVNLVPVSTPDSALFLFFCGCVAITAMILPGISGSFILLVLGKYAYVISGVLSADLGIAIPFALGCLVGIMGFSRVLGWLLDNWYEPMIALLTGLLVGSLWRIWPYQELTFAVVREKRKVVSAEPFLPVSFELTVAGLMIAGFLAVLLVEYLASRRVRQAS